MVLGRSVKKVAHLQGPPPLPPPPPTRGHDPQVENHRSSCSLLKVKWLWNHRESKAVVLSSWPSLWQLQQQLRVGCLWPSGGFNVLHPSHASLLCQSPGHGAWDLCGGAALCGLLHPPRRCTCAFSGRCHFSCPLQPLTCRTIITCLLLHVADSYS